MAMFRVALALVAGLGMISCGAQPIPLKAVAGSTITILVPPAFYPGFGRVITGDPAAAPAYDPLNPLEDLQRGELVFRLCEFVNCGAGQPGPWLERVAVTRVKVDEAASGVTQAGPLGLEKGQVIALVNLPSTGVEGDYWIQVERYRRDRTVAGLPFEKVDTFIYYGGWPWPWLGWGDSRPNFGIPIHIVPEPVGAPTPVRGWAEFGGYNSFWIEEDDWVGVTPDPTFTILVPHDFGPPPAAWELKLNYPVKKMRITGVELFRHKPSEAMVRFDTNDNGSATCSTPDDVLTIQVVDPDQKAGGVEVAFELRNFTDTCGGRVDPANATEFSIASLTAYDLGGNEVAGVMAAIVNHDR